MKYKNPRVDQLLLSTIWDPSLHRPVLEYLLQFSIVTAEELVSSLRSGLEKPSSLSEDEWKELLSKVKKALPANVLRQCTRKSKRKFPLLPLSAIIRNPQ